MCNWITSTKEKTCSALTIIVFSQSCCTAFQQRFYLKVSLFKSEGEIFFLTLSKNARKYLKHPFCEKSEKRDGIPIPFCHPTPTKQLHYIKFTWREDKNLLTFCWPYRHRNLCRHYKSHISSDFYIQNLMLQSPKPNVKSSRWVKPWHQFRFWACWLAVDGDSSGAQRLAFTLHLTWGAFFSFFLSFLFFFFCHMLLGTLNQNYFTRTICYEKHMMESEWQEVASYHWVMYYKHN